MANNCLNRSFYSRKAKEKEKGFYSKIEDQQIFKKRVEAKQQCLPGDFYVDRIISSRGREKVGINSNY